MALDSWIGPALILAVLAILGLMCKAAYWVGAVSSERKDIKSTASDDRSVLRGFMQEIRDDIKKILLRIPPQTVAAGSPRRLTDFGKVIAEKIGAEQWANDLAPSLVPRTKDMQPFEVDAFSYKHVKTSLSDEMGTAVASCAYEAGTSSDNVIAVPYVVLRDALLRASPPHA